MEVAKHSFFIFLCLASFSVFSMVQKSYHYQSGYRWEESDIVLQVHNKEKKHQKSKMRFELEGYSFTVHVQKRMESRGIETKDILAVLKSGKRRTLEGGLLFCYIRKMRTAVVLAEDKTTIVTAYKTVSNKDMDRLLKNNKSQALEPQASSSNQNG